MCDVLLFEGEERTLLQNTVGWEFVWWLGAAEKSSVDPGIQTSCAL